MADTTDVIDALDARVKRREERREFFKMFGAAVAMTGAAALATKSGPAGAQTAPSDADVLNFALNLEYLEAQFYYYASYGAGLPMSLATAGTPGSGGPQGVVTGGRQVNFTDTAVQAYAREIANDERAHVEFLRGALGASAVAMPNIDISSNPNGGFSTAARAAGLITAGQSFDPYASDENFLLAAFIFEDVGVTAYKGAARFISNKVFLEAAAGLLAVEAYHAAIVRTTLYAKGIAAPNLITAVQGISDARDRLDGSSDLDQGITPMVSGADTTSNIVPLDNSNGLAFSRSTGQVLNIVYLNNLQVTGGGFFPNGVNGTNAALRMSAAN